MANLQVDLGLAIVGYPLAVAGVGVAAARLLPAQSAARQAALALGTGASLVTSHLAIAKWPKWPPVDSLGWIPVGTAAATLAALVLAFVPGKAAIKAALLVVLGVVLASYFAGKPTFTKDVSALLPLALGAGLAGTIAVVSHQVVTTKSSTATPWLGLLVTAAIGAACALWARTASAKLAMLIGSMATTAGTVGIGGLVLRLREGAPLAHGLFIINLTSTLVYAHLYSRLPGLSLALLAGGVGSVALAAVLGKKPVVKAALVIAVAAITAGAAAGLQYKDKAAREKQQSSYY